MTEPTTEELRQALSIACTILHYSKDKTEHVTNTIMSNFRKPIKELDELEQCFQDEHQMSADKFMAEAIIMMQSGILSINQEN